MNNVSYGYRRIHQALLRNNIKINKKTVHKLMKVNNLFARYPKKKHNKVIKNDRQFISKYLLKNIEINRKNQVWATDITYLITTKGTMYLSAIIDIYSRYIVGWKIGNTMDTSLCTDTLKDAVITQKAAPCIINSDQGSQYTSSSWHALVKSFDSQLSMDGIGRWADNIYIERFWNTVKNEELRYHKFDSVSFLKKTVSEFIDYYNNSRLHSSLSYKTPSEIYHDYSH